MLAPMLDQRCAEVAHLFEEENVLVDGWVGTQGVDHRIGVVLDRPGGAIAGEVGDEVVDAGPGQ